MDDEIKVFLTGDEDFSFAESMGNQIAYADDLYDFICRINRMHRQNAIEDIISDLNKDRLIQIFIILSRYSVGSPFLNSDIPETALAEIQSGRVNVHILRIDDVDIPPSLKGFDVDDFYDPFNTTYSTDFFSRSQENQPSGIRRILDNSQDSLQSLIEFFANKDLSLVLGAGMSLDAGVPDWNTLLQRIGEEAITKFKEENPDGKISDNEHYWFTYDNRINPVVRSRGYKSILQEQLPHSIKDAIYKDTKPSSRFYNSLTRLISKYPGHIDSIISFNFDSFVEDHVGQLGQPIYSDSTKNNNGALPVYHVHGYIPRTGHIPENQNLVFTEDEYHMKYESPEDWSNKIQIGKFSQSHCLFLGLSLTDPNLRRLLDLTSQQISSDNQKHFTIKEIPVDNGHVNQFEMMLFERDCEQFNIKVIWVQSYQHIPNLIDLIRTQVLNP